MGVGEHGGRGRHAVRLSREVVRRQDDRQDEGGRMQGSKRQDDGDWRQYEDEREDEGDIRQEGDDSRRGAGAQTRSTVAENG